MTIGDDLTGHLDTLQLLPLPLVIIKRNEILWHNTAFSSLVGSDSESLVGNDIRTYQAPEYVDILTKIGFRREKGQQVPDVYDSIMIDHHGRRLPITVKGMRVQYKDINCTMALLLDRSYDFNNDISVLDIQLRALQATNQLDFLENTIAGLNHNLNNHLTTLKISLELLTSDNTPSDEEIILMEMNKSVKNLSNITKFLKLFEGSTKSELRSTKLMPYLREFLTDYNYDNLIVHNELQDDVMVMIDQRQFRRFLDILQSFLYVNTNPEKQIEVYVMEYQKRKNRIKVVHHDLDTDQCIMLKFRYCDVNLDPVEFIKDFLPFSGDLDIEKGTYLSNISKIIKTLNFGLEFSFNPEFEVVIQIPVITKIRD